MTDLVASLPLAPLAAALRAGRLDLGRHVEDACDRLGALDPLVQAFLPEPGRRERLRREAAALIARFPDPASRPPLFGVLAGVKDIFRADGFPTGAGARLPASLFGGPEASVVSALRAAGALVLGKTVTTEFAYFEPGATRNPHALDHTPGGSSSGSAAAVAAGFCALALGSQTIGSTIRPAAYCGIAGFKPTFGRIDPSGAIFIAPSLDHVGLFAQDVAGLALAASALCAGWREGAAGERPVLGIPEGPYLEQVPAETLAAFRARVEALRAAGYAARFVPMFLDLDDIVRRHLDLMSGEMALVHREWFAAHERLYRERTVAFIRRGQAVAPEALDAARARQREVRDAIHARMRESGVDAWIAPATLGPAPEGLERTGDPAMSFPWTFAGLPAVAIPAGASPAGLPLGVQLVGAFGDDERVLARAEPIAAVLAGAETR